MFNTCRKEQFVLYNKARANFIENPEQLIELEEFLSSAVKCLIEEHKEEIIKDYNEATYLYNFWKNYPPDDRGRKPKGDQYPWIEVGEHVIGVKVARYLRDYFNVCDCGLPTGPDQRIILRNPQIKKILHGLSDAAWLMFDIKSAGPRDNFSHTVMSHNQISGSGEWLIECDGLKNSILIANGNKSHHNFYPSLSPLYVLSDNTIVPVVTLAIKPIYKMLSLDGDNDGGQPLDCITQVCIPNGLLLLENPGYLKKYPGLLFPGKDDKGKNPLKVRSRVSFDLLKEIDQWRIENIKL